jgi:hypothetical protein
MFTLTVDPAKNLADAVMRQSRLVLASSEAVRHLRVFKDPKVTKEAAYLIKKVTDEEQLDRFDNLQGCLETL